MLGKWKSNRTFNFKPVNDEDLLQECWQKEREKVVARMKQSFESSGREIQEDDADVGDCGKLHYWYLHQLLLAEWKEATGRSHQVWEKGKLPKKKDIMPIVLVGYIEKDRTLFLQYLSLEVVDHKLTYYQHDTFLQLTLQSAAETDRNAEREKEKEK